MLAIDVGNTHITIGLFKKADLKAVFRVSTERCLKGAAFFEYLPEVREHISPDAVISSVRTPVTDIIIREFEAKTGKRPLVVDVYTPMGIEVCYETKETLGVDRLICAAAAYCLYRKEGRAVVTVDMGTATTIDYVTEDGIFIGGMITPGLRSSYQGLLAAAPQLPNLDDLLAHVVIGNSTAECVRSGVTIGHAAMIRGVAEMMAQAKGTLPIVVLTGGLSGMVRDILPRDYIVDDNLILKGLSIVFNLHSENKC